MGTGMDVEWSIWILDGWSGWQNQIVQIGGWSE
jgi:hypothetical protein